MILLLIMSAAQGFRNDLGFLYPVAKEMLPQEAELTIYSFNYKYENSKFNLQNNTLNKIDEHLAKGKAFDSLKVKARPIPYLAKSVRGMIDSIQLLFEDLEDLTNQEYTYGEIAAVNETKDVNTDIWFLETTFNDITRIAKNIEADKDHGFPGEFSTDATAKELLNNMILLQNEIFKHYQQLKGVLRLLTDIKTRRLSSNSKMILEQHYEKRPNNSILDSMEVTYYNSEEGSIDFEIKVIVTGDLELFTKYKSVPYLNFRINRTYYSDSANTRLFALECLNEICSEIDPDECGEALYDKELSLILMNCPFEYESARYEITTSGIFIYSTPPEDLQALMDKHKLTAEEYPALIQFSDCYKLKQGNVLVSGCLDLETKQYSSRYDQQSIDAYFNPYFIVLVWNYIKNGPLATVLILPVSLLLCLCGFSSCCKRLGREKPKYRRIEHQTEMGRINKIGRYNNTHSSRRSNRSNKSDRSNRSGRFQSASQ